MKVNAVSFKTTSSRTDKSVSTPLKSNPNFGVVYYGSLKPKDIKKLYQDGPGIWRMLSENIPILHENLGNLLAARVDVHPNMFRNIQIAIRQNFERREDLVKYIIENNDKKFHFPQKLIEIYKTQSLMHREWLETYNYKPFDISYDDLGFVESNAKLAKFVKEANPDTFIKEMYKLDVPVLDKVKETKKIPSYYWEFPGG